jgi:hypothetical protein
LGRKPGETVDGVMVPNMGWRSVAIALVLVTGSWLAAQAPETPGATRPPVWLGIDPLHRTPRSTETVAALDALREALGSRGFRIAASAEQSTVRVELTSQRMIGAGRGATPSRFLGGGEIVLIRTTVSHGDELAEVRGRSTESNRPWRSAAVEAVRGLDQLVSNTKATSTAPTGDSVVRQAVAANRRALTPELLSRMRDFIARYQQSFASIVAEEQYRQEYWQRRLPYPSPLQATRRDLRSEMGFAFFPGTGIWFGFRDVLEADGTAIPDRNRELQKLFLDRRVPTSEQFKRVAESSARFNIGPAVRNFNVPMTTLLFASPEHRDRCQFELLRTERHDGLETAVIAFTETARPTLITRNGHDRPSRGLFWVETASGRILRTDLAIAEDTIEVRLTTWFAHNDHTDMVVPTKMREVYDFVPRLDEYVETLATYTNFRRFETTTRIKP